MVNDRNNINKIFYAYYWTFIFLYAFVAINNFNRSSVVAKNTFKKNNAVCWHCKHALNFFFFKFSTLTFKCSVVWCLETYFCCFGDILFLMSSDFQFCFLVDIVSRLKYIDFQIYENCYTTNISFPLYLRSFYFLFYYLFGNSLFLLMILDWQIQKVL